MEGMKKEGKEEGRREGKAMLLVRKCKSNVRIDLLKGNNEEKEKHQQSLLNFYEKVAEG